MVPSQIKVFLQKVLPGIFIVGITIGTGSVTTMSKAGADFGMSLMWIIFISAVISFTFYYLSSKFAVVTRLPFLYAMGKYWHISTSLQSVPPFLGS
jgi:Mn2+/Fe2+ NRAMP family transporter